MRSWFLRLLEIIVVGKGLIVFSKGLVVFITSSNCLWKSLSGKEYNQYAHNKNMRRDIQLLCHNLNDWVFYTGMKKNDCFLI